MNDCAICQRKIKRNSLTTGCRHTFHGKCLSKWSTKANSCPLCRASGISNAVLRNIVDTKNEFIATSLIFETHFQNIDYRYIRLNFPMFMFTKKQRDRIANNKYLITILWVLLFDSSAKYKDLKSAYIQLIKVYTKLYDKLNNKPISEPFLNINRNLNRHVKLYKQSIHFLYYIYPFNMFVSDSGNDFPIMLHRDFTFMKRIVKALKLHEHPNYDENVFNRYIKFLTRERKLYYLAKLFN